METFLLGAREMEDTTEGSKVYSPQSPLGSAIIGKKKGDTVTYEAPNGKHARGRDRRRGALHRLTVRPGRHPRRRIAASG